MPYKNPKDRKWSKAAQEYEDSPKIKKHRNERKRARYELEKEGLVAPNDGKDVHHVKALSRGGKNARSNLAAVPASENRSFARQKDHSMKSEVSTRERKKK